MKQRRQEDRRIEREMDLYAGFVLFLLGSLGKCMKELDRLEKEAKAVGYTHCVKVPPTLKETARMALTYVEELEAEDAATSVPPTS